MKAALKKEGKNKMGRKLCDMMASVPHSMDFPNTYREVEDASRARKASVIRKAKAMSDILKTRLIQESL